MEKKTMVKFLVVLLVSIGIAIYGIVSWFGVKKDPTPEEIFRGSDDKVNETSYDLDENWDSLLEENEGESNDDVMDDETIIEDENDNEDKQSFDENDTNYSDLYVEQHGESPVEQATEVTKVVIAMYLMENKKWEQWQEYLTPDYLNQIKENEQEQSSHAEREIKEIEVFASEPSREDEMVFGVFPTWIVKSQDKSVKEQMDLFYVTFVFQKDSWLVKKIDSPGMEMEGGNE